MVHWPMIGSWVLFGQGFCRGWGQDPWTIQPDSRESTANASFRTVRGARSNATTARSQLHSPAGVSPDLRRSLPVVLLSRGQRYYGEAPARLSAVKTAPTDVVGCLSVK